MAMVKVDRQFSYIFVGSPGKNHDSFILKQSTLQQNLQSNCNAYFDYRKYHKIGESAFLLLKQCIFPYKQTDGEHLYPDREKYFITSYRAQVFL
jgi:hypothetical protein